MQKGKAKSELDVLIIGAGISGVGAACHMRRNAKHKSFAIVDQRERIGGTWDLFRYPGIRSDSDMFTFGYKFKPWVSDRSLAEGHRIREYLEETANEYNVANDITFNTQAIVANWDSKTARWTVETENLKTGERSSIVSKFLFMGAGYYRYDEAYVPDFEGKEDFKGQVVHPQFWPEDLDYSDKKVVVIGSGATAITLVPNLAKRAKKVIQLQRSPSYVVSMPGNIPVNGWLGKFLPAQMTYDFIRFFVTRGAVFFFKQSRNYPKQVKKLLIYQVRRQLPKGYDVDKHFTPSYDPWDQRVCAVPNGDFFKAIKNGSVEIVTDHIERFTETGIQLKSGDHIGCDMIVTATGFKVQLVGGVKLTMDGTEVDLSKKLSYKSMMFSDIPNLINCVGYTNNSWTLKSDLTGEYLCRLIKHMDKKKYDIAVPRQHEKAFGTKPYLDFQAGYILRALDDLPKQGEKEPWLTTQDYLYDRKVIQNSPIEDGVLEFKRAALSEPQPAGKVIDFKVSETVLS